MRVLITGCGGMLGEAVYAEFRKAHHILPTDIDLNESWLSYLDVRNPAEAEWVARHFRPDAILHLAALTDMERCELDPEDAYNTNFMGTANMIRVARKCDLPLVYISSAGVFDGSKEVYDEGDEPNPLNVYAKSKYAGELVALSYPKSIVVRAGWMMGGGPRKDKKFVNKIIGQIRQGRKELFVVQDKLGTPTYTYDLAKTLLQLYQDRSYGVFHGSCDGGGSRVDVAREILRGLGVNGEIPINVVDSDHFKDEYFAMRPASEKLVSRKLDPAPPWQERLEDYLGRFDW